MNKYGYFEPRKPRQTEEGIKARSQRGEFADHWWAERWIKSLEQITNPGRLRRGRSYARGGQVLSIQEKNGEIHALVQGSQTKPYRITIRLRPLSDAQWQAVLEALSERAIFSAQLLAGEMPKEIEEVFTAAGVSLLPHSPAELETNCTCPDWANPCKHVAAVHYILGEQFDDDPFLIFRLRGRNQEQIMATLRRQREAQQATTTVAEMPAQYEVAEESAPLEASPTTFWQMAHPLEHFPTSIQAPTQRYPILRRLGPPAFAKNLEAELGPVYDAMTQEALAVAYTGDSAGTDNDQETVSDAGEDVA